MWVKLFTGGGYASLLHANHTLDAAFLLRHHERRPDRDDLPRGRWGWLGRRAELDRVVDLRVDRGYWVPHSTRIPIRRPWKTQLRVSHLSPWRPGRLQPAVHKHIKHKKRFLLCFFGFSARFSFETELLEYNYVINKCKYLASVSLLLITMFWYFIHKIKLNIETKNIK